MSEGLSHPGVLTSHHRGLRLFRVQPNKSGCSGELICDKDRFAILKNLKWIRQILSARYSTLIALRFRIPGVVSGISKVGVILQPGVGVVIALDQRFRLIGDRSAFDNTETRRLGQ